MYSTSTRELPRVLLRGREVGLAYTLHTNLLDNFDRSNASRTYLPLRLNLKKPLMGATFRNTRSPTSNSKFLRLTLT